MPTASWTRHSTRQHDSGEDFVLEYGDAALHLQRARLHEACEQAALKLGSSTAASRENELDDLVTLAVNGEIRPRPRRSASTSTTAGRSSAAHRTARSCTGCGGWSSAPPGGPARQGGRARHRVLRQTQTFGYVQPDRDGEAIELSPEALVGRSPTCRADGSRARPGAPSGHAQMYVPSDPCRHPGRHRSRHHARGGSSCDGARRRRRRRFEVAPIERGIIYRHVKAEDITDHWAAAARAARGARRPVRWTSKSSRVVH